MLTGKSGEQELIQVKESEEEVDFEKYETEDTTSDSNNKHESN